MKCREAVQRKKKLSGWKCSLHHSLIQDYFLETLEERNYFGLLRLYQRYMLKEVRHFPALIRQRPLTALSSDYGR